MNFGRGHDSTHQHLIRLDTRNARCALRTGSRGQGSARTGGAQCGGVEKAWRPRVGAVECSLQHTGSHDGRNFLAVQRLGLRILTAKGPGSFPGWGTKDPTRHTVWPKRKKKNEAMMEIVHPPHIAHIVGGISFCHAGVMNLRRGVLMGSDVCVFGK